ncbi:MAG TPA: ABC transporter permease [Thermodesulfovibrionales bacterium]|jgi:lipopolysaccharide transport system permease protein|nr:ABC transporter permease [Thermodesulfovibrionales bacterium]
MFARFSKEILRSPVEIIRNLYTYRHILSQMVIREIKGRFVGSVGGLFWHFIHPVVMMVIYLFVFVYIFKLRVGTGGGAGASAIYLLAGLFPWIILAEGLLRGTSSLIENANLIQKTSFPTEILTTKAVLAPLLSYGIAIILLMAYKSITSGFYTIFLVLPLILLLQVFFTLGISFISATMTVFFRDVMQLVQLGISFWIYVTPILYPVSMLPPWAQQAMYINPLYPFMSVYQSLLLQGTTGASHMFLLSSAWALIFFIFGSFIFGKLKNEFADWL